MLDKEKEQLALLNQEQAVVSNQFGTLDVEIKTLLSTM
jgi:hypothetical protein